MPLRQPSSEGYARNLVRDGTRVLIESRCVYCGVVIVGSVPQLEQDEQTHRHECSGRAKQAASRR